MAKLGKAATKRRGRSPKIKQRNAVEKMLAANNGFILAENKGLTVEAVTKLRATLRGKKVGYKVAKNRVIAVALKNKGIDPKPVEHLLHGPTVFVAGAEDPITPAKLLVDAAKASDGKLVIKGGFFEGRPLDAKGVELLAQTPGREVLLGRLVGSMQSPAQKLVYGLNQAVAKVVYAVDAHRRKLEGGAA